MEARAGTLHISAILPSVNIKVSVYEQMYLHKDLTTCTIQKHLNESPGWWQTLICRSGLAQKGTLLYEYPSARPDLQIRIRHWNIPKDCQFSVYFIIMQEAHSPCVGSATSDTDHINYAADCTDLTISSNLYEVAFHSLHLQLTIQ